MDEAVRRRGQGLRHLRGRGQVEQQQSDVLHGPDMTAPGARRNDGLMVSPLELRGLPMLSRNVGGVQPGTQPEQALLAKEARRDRRR